MITHEMGKTTNFVGLVNALIPRVGTKEMESESSDSSDSEEDSLHKGSEKTVVDLLECFQAISLNGLKIGLDNLNGKISKAEFMPSLSGLNLVKKFNRNDEKVPEIKIDTS